MDCRGFWQVACGALIGLGLQVWFAVFRGREGYGAELLNCKYYLVMYQEMAVGNVEVICCITIIGIPFGKQFLKLQNCL